MIKEIEYDVIIIGAGQCGIALAYYLEKLNIPYLIFEKERTFSSWYKRWDSFYTNTANWMNLLPGMQLSANKDNNSRCSKLDIIKHFEDWAKNISPNIRPGRITNIKYEKNQWLVETEKELFKAKQVVVAVGPNKKTVPQIHTKIPKNIKQIHSSEYTNSSLIETSKVLIVGTGGSGVQICEELAKINKYSLYLSCSNNKYFPWTIFGISIYRYVKLFNLFGISSRSLIGKMVKLLLKNKRDPATPPRPDVLQSRYNIVLKGKVVDVKDDVAIFENNETLSLKNTTIIWCTGYKLDLAGLIDNSIQNQVLHDNGYPKLSSVFESEIPNLYFIGLRFQRLVSSHAIYGGVRDAEFLALEIQNNLNNCCKSLSSH